MIMLIILFIVSVILNIILIKTLYVLMQRYNNTEKRMMKNKKEMIDIFRYINQLELENESLKVSHENIYDIPDKNDIKEALKFAMLQAHPDNPNGSNEKFIKYKNMYDKLYRRDCYERKSY